MFKKHIRAWGMSKYMKAEQKDAAISSLLKEMPATHEKRKILRHARQRVKLGTLDEACYRNAVRQGKEMSGAETGNSRGNYTTLACKPDLFSAKAIKVAHGLLPPDKLLASERLFHSVPLLVLMNNSRKITGDLKGLGNQGYDIGVSLDAAITHYELCSFREATSSFRNAAKMIQSCLEYDFIPEVTLIYYLNPDMWGGCWEPYVRFAAFVSNLSEAVLGQDHQLTYITKALSQAQNKLNGSEVARVWDCIMDNLVLSGLTVTIWYNAAKKHLEHYTQYGMFERVADFCSKYTNSLQEMDLLTDGRAIGLKHELARSLARQGHFDQAVVAFNQVVAIAARCLHRYDWYVISVHMQLARIPEYGCYSILSARLHYVEAFRTSAAYCGPRFSETLHILRDLLDFGRYHGFDRDGLLPLWEYQESYHALKEFTEGLWDARSGVIDDEYVRAG